MLINLQKIKSFLINYPTLYKLAFLMYRILFPTWCLLIRLVKLPVKLLRLNYLTVKSALFGRRYIIDPADASFFADGFATVHKIGFLKDKKFLRSYDDSFNGIEPNIARAAKKTILWRAHIVTWAANQALKLDGDFVECGVWWGTLSKVICEYTNFEKHTDKKFYLIDTWGDPKTSNLKHQKRYPDNLFNKVEERFNKYPNVKLIRGPVPEILDKVPVKKIAYLSIDMNGDVAERATLEKYYDQMVKGGIIYFDDYGFGMYEKLRATVDEFFSDKPETLLHFPTGISLMIKQ